MIHAHTFHAWLTVCLLCIIAPTFLFTMAFYLKAVGRQAARDHYDNLIRLADMRQKRRDSYIEAKKLWPDFPNAIAQYDAAIKKANADIAEVLLKADSVKRKSRL